ncbi:DUF488 domain-containing protein [Cypionkella sp. TWP1-2-1b2]|uniref:DUF488 domain-containing protein n=1 Tax=Cypionkella sp. TWP1-2-1b2 TaxID=2804675 RepID=UPI003CF18222
MPPNSTRQIKPPQIHLIRAYDIRAGTPTLGARLLVDRLWPRGIAKSDLPIEAWLKSATPSPNLRKWFGHDPAKWADFTARYRAELTATPEPLAEALKWCRKGPVTLIYAARDTNHTHALILRDVLLETLTHEANHA